MKLLGCTADAKFQSVGACSGAMIDWKKDVKQRSKATASPLWTCPGCPSGRCPADAALRGILPRAPNPLTRIGAVAICDPIEPQVSAGPKVNHKHAVYTTPQAAACWVQCLPSSRAQFTYDCKWPKTYPKFSAIFVAALSFSMRLNYGGRAGKLGNESLQGL